MLKALKQILGSWSGDAAREDATPADPVAFAAAALMVEAARIDGAFEPFERVRIVERLSSRFGMSDEDARALLYQAETKMESSTQLVPFTRVLKDSLEYEDRVQVLQVLWEVALADGELHDYEANLLRRVAGLLYVSDQDSGAARKRAQQGIEDQADRGAET